MAKTPKKKKTHKDKERQAKFVEECAKGLPPYKAAIKAGYAESTAKAKSYKMVVKRSEEIEKKRPIVQAAIETEFKYSVQDSFRKLCEIQSLALLPNDKGDYCNLSAATKAEELKGRMYGVYELDNKQKTPQNPVIKVASETEKQLLDDI